jgi:hypothetical protein
MPLLLKLVEVRLIVLLYVPDAEVEDNQMAKLMLLNRAKVTCSLIQNICATEYGHVPLSTSQCFSRQRPIMETPQNTRAESEMLSIVEGETGTPSTSRSVPG